MKLNVAVTLRITPKDIDTDLSSIENELSKIAENYGRLHKSEIKPIAFGLSCVEAILLLDDSRGGTDEIEAELKKLDSVSQVDIIDVNRL
ncbi:MAG: elongation factor 1-beta [Candidatus Altiarchaeota archaeon]|nr:elongation factor 1-beta [Candidatus Altiarchaeota archaeon]